MEPDDHAVEPLDFGFAVSVIPIVLTDSLEASMALHDLYHGARANKLLFNIRNGSITADSSERSISPNASGKTALFMERFLRPVNLTSQNSASMFPPRHD